MNDPATTKRLRAWAEIDLTAIADNVRAVKSFVGDTREVMAVVKADAYGHGLVPVANAALAAGASCLGVATVDEGATLRRSGVDAPVLLLCAPFPDQASDVIANELIAAVGDSTLASALAHAARPRIDAGRPPEVHLDVDTGMGRSGAQTAQAVDLWRTLTGSGLTVTGLTTHLADADGAEERFSRGQLLKFSTARDALTSAGARFQQIHLANSAATVRFPGESQTLVRPGLLLYGIRPPLPSRFHLRAVPIVPALSLHARIASVRKLLAGQTISYGVTHTLARDSVVATVLIGYGDGYPRRLSNVGSVLINGRRAPILGRVCMDQTVVDVTDIPDVNPGDVATLIGADGADRISVEEIARLIDATEHEITTSLTSRIDRIYTHR